MNQHTLENSQCKTKTSSFKKLKRRPELLLSLADSRQVKITGVRGMYTGRGSRNSPRLVEAFGKQTPTFTEPAATVSFRLHGRDGNTERPL